LKQQPFTIIYQDERLIAVNKAAGLSVGGERWDESAERLDKLLASSLGLDKLYTVHRIDKDTSGLVVFAKEPDTHKRLSMAFQTRSVHKLYLAVVHGLPAWEDGSCDLPLVVDGDKRHRTIVDKYQGKKSFTAFHLVATLSGAKGPISLLECRPETGRTHQIRVHLAQLGLPIVCDSLYGKSAFRSVEPGLYLSDLKARWNGDVYEERPLLNRLGLHALRLELPAKLGGDTFTAPLPRDMKAFINQMGKIVKKDLLEAPTLSV
jgi:RluA family pseudouridine synthase